MTSQRASRQDDQRFRILRQLQQNPEISQRDLAREVGISVGGIHYALNALIEKGLVKIGNFTAAEDKRRYAYLITPKGIAEKSVLTAAFLQRKLAEYEMLKDEIEMLRNEVDGEHE